MSSNSERNRTFGEFFKNHRIAKGMTLRTFCQTYGLDPGNISKLERGVLAPPESLHILKKYASYLSVTEGSKDWYTFVDLASAGSGRLPADLMEEKELVTRLPVLFRTIKRKKLSPNDLDKLIEKLRKV